MKMFCEILQRKTFPCNYQTFIGTCEAVQSTAVGCQWIQLTPCTKNSLQMSLTCIKTVSAAKHRFNFIVQAKSMNLSHGCVSSITVIVSKVSILTWKCMDFNQRLLQDLQGFSFLFFLQFNFVCFQLKSTSILQHFYCFVTGAEKLFIFQSF